MANQLVNARVDKEIKDQAAAFLAAVGLTVSVDDILVGGNA